MLLRDLLLAAAAAALCCVRGRTAGIFIQSIFRSPLAESDRRTAKEEVARCRSGGVARVGRSEAGASFSNRG